MELIFDGRIIQRDSHQCAYSTMFFFYILALVNNVFFILVGLRKGTVLHSFNTETKDFQFHTDLILMLLLLLTASFLFIVSVVFYKLSLS